MNYPMPVRICETKKLLEYSVCNTYPFSIFTQVQHMRMNLNGRTVRKAGPIRDHLHHRRLRRRPQEVLLTARHIARCRHQWSIKPRWLKNL